MSYPDKILAESLGLFWSFRYKYRQTSNVSRIRVGNKIVDHSDAVGA